MKTIKINMWGLTGGLGLLIGNLKTASYFYRDNIEEIDIKKKLKLFSNAKSEYIRAKNITKLIKDTPVNEVKKELALLNRELKEIKKNGISWYYNELYNYIQSEFNFYIILIKKQN